MRPISTEMSLDMLGKYMALEDMVIVMMGMFLSDEQRDQLRSVLSTVRHLPWQHPQLSAEIAEQIQIGRYALFDRMLDILDAHAEKAPEKGS